MLRNACIIFYARYVVGFFPVAGFDEDGHIEPFTIEQSLHVDSHNSLLLKNTIVIVKKIFCVVVIAISYPLLALELYIMITGFPERCTSFIRFFGQFYMSWLLYCAAYVQARILAKTIAYPQVQYIQ